MSDPTLSLVDLRREIDRIDEAMHRLLMERGAIIDRLIAVKGTQASGSAFRPGREAEMMRRLVARHSGHLPLDTVESIWRVVISTFTYLQAPYTVHADASVDRDAIRDVARFHFGFSVPLEIHPSSAAALKPLAATPGDLALVPLTSDEAWWRGLGTADGPQVIARLPFVDRHSHPVGLPVLVVGRAGEGAAATDIEVVGVAAERWTPEAWTAVAGAGGEVLSVAAAPPVGPTDVLVAVPSGRAGALTAALGGFGLREHAAVGTYAAPTRVAAAPAPDAL